MRTPPRVAVLLAALALAACSHETAQPAGITVDDQAELNDAAAMLDANSVDLNDVTDVDEPEAPPPAANAMANRQDK